MVGDHVGIPAAVCFVLLMAMPYNMARGFSWAES